MTTNLSQQFQNTTDGLQIKVYTLFLESVRLISMEPDSQMSSLWNVQ